MINFKSEYVDYVKGCDNVCICVGMYNSAVISNGSKPKTTKLTPACWLNAGENSGGWVELNSAWDLEHLCLKSVMQGVIDISLISTLVHGSRLKMEIHQVAAGIRVDESTIQQVAFMPSGQVL